MKLTPEDFRKQDEFLKDLKELLKKHDAEIRADLYRVAYTDDCWEASLEVCLKSHSNRLVYFDLGRSIP